MSDKIVSITKQPRSTNQLYLKPNLSNPKPKSLPKSGLDHSKENVSVSLAGFILREARAHCRRFHVSLSQVIQEALEAHLLMEKMRHDRNELWEQLSLNGLDDAS